MISHKGIQLPGNSTPAIKGPEVETGSLRVHLQPTLPPLQNAVLCVDRDMAARSSLQSALPHCEIVRASGAYEALRKINIRAFDMYVLDYWLPDWCGLSLCRDIRKADPHVPVCFYTSIEQPEHRQHAERAGASGYLLKLLDTQILNDQISPLLQLKAQRDKAAGIAAWGWIQQELAQHVAALATGTSQGDVQKTRERNAQTMARNVFLEAKGTLAGFYRTWQPLWIDALEMYSKANKSLA